MAEVTVSFEVTPTDPACPLSLTVWLDDVAVSTVDHVDQQYLVSMQFMDSLQVNTHCLRIVMSGKQTAHTKLDTQGNFLQDPRLIISNFQVSELPSDNALHRLATYQHNFNGNGDLSTHQFNGVLGCNGTVTLDITTPVLMWLLEYT